MILLADESVDRHIVERLRHDGHRVLYVAEMEPGITDELVFQHANEQNALLITADKDFGELVFREHQLTLGGVALLRLAGLSSELKADIVGRVFREQAAALSHAFSVISPAGARIRPQG